MCARDTNKSTSTFTNPGTMTEASVTVMSMTTLNIVIATVSMSSSRSKRVDPDGSQQLLEDGETVLLRTETMIACHLCNPRGTQIFVTTLPKTKPTSPFCSRMTPNENKFCFPRLLSSFPLLRKRSRSGMGLPYLILELSCLVFPVSLFQKAPRF